MSNPEQWQRIRLDPAMSRAWTKAGELTLGFTATLREYPHQTHQWLTLFDGTRSGVALLESSAAMGIPRTVAERYLTTMADTGVIYQVDTLPAALADSRIVFDARAVGITHSTPALEVAQRRQATRLLIHGIGATSFQLVQRLDRLGYLVGWQCESSLRITSEDVFIGSLPDEWTGRKWSECGRTVTNPDIVIAVGDIHDYIQLELQFPHSLIVPVVVRTTEYEIGPLLHHRQSACARCVYETLVAENADWPLLLTQWLHNKRALPLISLSALDLLVATVINHIETYVSTGETALVSRSLHMSSAQPQWQTKQWKSMPGCECRFRNVVR